MSVAIHPLGYHGSACQGRLVVFEALPAIALLEGCAVQTEDYTLAVMEDCCERNEPCEDAARCEALYLQRAVDWRWRLPQSLGEQGNCTGSTLRTEGWLDSMVFHGIRPQRMTPGSW